MKDYVRLIISDLHLGNVHSRENDIYELLRSTDFDELILAGDVIDFIRVPEFTERSADIFSFVKDLNKTVIYIVGNHDVAFKKFIGKTVAGVKFVERYEFDYHGRR